VKKLLESMGKEISAIKANTLKLCWYMRGGITYEDAMHMGYKERNFINDLVKENLETTKKSGLPFF
jgi:hypothetical protein